MENGIQALFVAFAILIFIIALTVSFTSLNTAKKTADVVLKYSDREFFQDHVNADRNEYIDGGRTVKIDTVIATLLRCARENYAVRVINGSDDIVFDYAINNKEELKNNINNFVNNHINDLSEYRETYTEVTLDGITYTSTDGTALEENVGKKIYITYKHIP